MDFLLFDWLKAEQLCERERFSAHSRETIEAVLDLSMRLGREAYLPHYRKSDQIEPYLDGDRVHVLPEAGEALRQLANSGLPGASFDERLGGQQLPSVVSSAWLGILMAANTATAAFTMLSMANARLIATFGTPRQIEIFARPQIEGRWMGTMCLSEPQAGSGLGDILTRATPDGQDELGARYRLRGNKMWISGGDHEVSENIVHLVLAKLPDESGRLPDGTRGISLFIVPKWLDRNGGRTRNDVVVAGLNHKMGYRGISNCLLNFGEGRFTPDRHSGAVGYLVGELGQGLPIMFQMMNEARIAVGLDAAMLAMRARHLSSSYARERLQGRHRGYCHGAKMAPIIHHSDVKRMLLAQKSYAEGALALVFYASKLVDEEPTTTDAEASAETSDLLSLLTPIAKTWPSEFGLEATDLAIQIHGGYGYTRDFDVEQLHRDNRLNPIHEGTTGIQALDLVGRKIIKDGGRSLRILGRRVTETASAASAIPELASFAQRLDSVWTGLQDCCRALMEHDRNAALSNATMILRATGHVVVGWQWLDQCVAAHLCSGERGKRLFREKTAVCRYFFEYEIPKVDAWLEMARPGNDLFETVDPDLL